MTVRDWTERRLHAPVGHHLQLLPLAAQAQGVEALRREHEDTPQGIPQPLHRRAAKWTNSGKQRIHKLYTHNRQYQAVLTDYG